MRPWIQLVVVGVLLASGARPPLGAQSGPTFDIVSIKPNASPDSGTRIATLPGGRFIMSNTPLSAVVIAAFELQDLFQVDGLPEWTRKERFDIEAQAPAGVPIAFPGQNTALPRMLQAMLVDRMQLATHRATRTVPMLALVISRADGRLGPSLVRSSIDCTTAPLPPPAGSPDAIPARPDAPTCGNRATLDSFSGTGIPLDRLIRLIIAPRVGRPVVDRTGLTGTFNISLRFRPPQPQPAPGAASLPASADSDLPPIETAVEEQLGLKLEPIRQEAEVLVIDRIERPTLN